MTFPANIVESAEFNETVTELTAVREAIQQQTTDGRIHIVVAGRQMALDPNFTSTENTFTCSRGSVQSVSGTYCGKFITITLLGVAYSIIVSCISKQVVVLERLIKYGSTPEENG